MNVINDLVLYNLTEEENTEFQRKVNLLDDFTRTFNKRFYFRNVSDTFTMKEILSAEMSDSKLVSLCDAPRSVLKRVEVISYDINKYLKNAVDAGIFEDIKLKNLRGDILDSSKESLCIDAHQFFNMFGRGQDTLTDILNKDKTHLFESQQVISMIDNTVANYDYDESFVEKVMMAYPAYKGFVLSIVNENITKDRKIAILKKSFRQKDFNMYIEMFGAKLKDFNDLDLFIETVITNNNRIKNKESNLWNVFKRVFLGKKGRDSHYPDTGVNKKAFFDKYSKLLPAEVTIDFVNDMYCDYYIRRNLENFIKDMYNTEHIDSKLEYAIKCDKFSVLFSENLKNLFETNNNPKTRNLLINYYKVRRNCRASLGEMADHFGDGFTDYINKNFSSDSYDVSFLDIDTNVSNDRIAHYVLLTDELFNRITFYKKNPISSLFIEERCDYGSKDRVLRVKNCLDSLMKYSSETKREIIYNKIFSVFENEDVFADLVCLFSDVISKKRRDIVERFSGNWYQKLDPVQFMQEICDWIKNIFSTYYSDKVEIITAFDDLKTNVDLLMNI